MRIVLVYILLAWAFVEVAAQKPRNCECDSVPPSIEKVLTDNHNRTFSCFPATSTTTESTAGPTTTSEQPTTTAPPTSTKEITTTRPDTTSNGPETTSTKLEPTVRSTTDEITTVTASPTPDDSTTVLNTTPEATTLTPGDPSTTVPATTENPTTTSEADSLSSGGTTEENDSTVPPNEEQTSTTGADSLETTGEPSTTTEASLLTTSEQPTTVPSGQDDVLSTTGDESLKTTSGPPTTTEELLVATTETSTRSGQDDYWLTNAVTELNPTIKLETPTAMSAKLNTIESDTTLAEVTPTPASHLVTSTQSTTTTEMQLEETTVPVEIHSTTVTTVGPNLFTTEDHQPVTTTEKTVETTLEEIIRSTLASTLKEESTTVAQEDDLTTPPASSTALPDILTTLQVPTPLQTESDAEPEGTTLAQKMSTEEVLSPDSPEFPTSTEIPETTDKKGSADGTNSDTTVSTLRPNLLTTADHQPVTSTEKTVETTFEEILHSTLGTTVRPHFLTTQDYQLVTTTEKTVESTLEEIIQSTLAASTLEVTTTTVANEVALTTAPVSSTALPDILTTLQVPTPLQTKSDAEPEETILAQKMSTEEVWYSVHPEFPTSTEIPETTDKEGSADGTNSDRLLTARTRREQRRSTRGGSSTRTPRQFSEIVPRPSVTPDGLEEETEETSTTKESQDDESWWWFWPRKTTERPKTTQSTKSPRSAQRSSTTQPRSTGRGRSTERQAKPTKPTTAGYGASLEDRGVGRITLPGKIKTTTRSPTRTMKTSPLNTGTTLPTIGSDPETTTVTQDPSTMELATTTERESRACPEGYYEGTGTDDFYCFIAVPRAYRGYYMLALTFCRQVPSRAMISFYDLRFLPTIQEFRFMVQVDRDYRNDTIYLNGMGNKMNRKEKKAALIRLHSANSVLNHVDGWVGTSTDIGNVTGICKLPKYGKAARCELDVIRKIMKDKIEMFAANTLESGEIMTLRCAPPSATVIRVRCGTFGELTPHPDYYECLYPHGHAGERPEKEIPGNMKIRKSCSECYRDGTAACVQVKGGFKCVCRPGFYKFTCYASISTCKAGQCRGRGECRSALGHSWCVCNEGYFGSDCQIDLTLRSWLPNVTMLPVISSNTYSAGLLLASTGARFPLKILLNWISVTGQDPQEVSQDWRAVMIAFAQIVILSYPHADTLGYEPRLCRYEYILVHAAYCLAILFLLTESMNVTSTIMSRNRNNFGVDNYGRRVFALDIPFRVMFPFVLVTAFMAYVLQLAWEVIPTHHTCYGFYLGMDARAYLPLVCFMAFGAIGAFGFGDSALCGIRRLRDYYVAQLHLIEVTAPYDRELIEKVRRNIPFMLILPLLLFMTWLTQMLANGHPLDFFKHAFFISHLVFSCAYSAVNLLQFLFTNSVLYEKFVYFSYNYLPRYFTEKYLPDMTPVKWLSYEECIAKHTGEYYEDQPRDSFYHPRSPCYISKEEEHMIQRKFSRRYLAHRLKHFSPPQMAVQQVRLDEAKLDTMYHRSPAYSNRHFELIFERWADEVLKCDKVHLHPRQKRAKETWRTRIRRKNRMPKPENTNIKRMRFLRNCLDFNLKQLRTGVEYYAESPLGRTDARMFYMAQPSVLRSQLGFLRENCLPYINVYVEADWKIRETHHRERKRRGLRCSRNDPECMKACIHEDHWLNELRPGFVGPLSFPLFYLPALRPYLELDYYQRFCDLMWCRIVKHREYLDASYDFAREF